MPVGTLFGPMEQEIFLDILYYKKNYSPVKTEQVARLANLYRCIGRSVEKVSLTLRI
jgi:hypothetical protein